MKKKNNAYLTIEEKRAIILNDEPMPTAIFTADKKDYIVKPRTIFGTERKKKKHSII